MDTDSYMFDFPTVVEKITLTFETEGVGYSLQFDKAKGMSIDIKKATPVDIFPTFHMLYNPAIMEEMAITFIRPTCEDEGKYGRMTVTPQPCPLPVGDRPYWMSEYQWDPCACILLKNHGGPCKCSHSPKEN